MKQVLLDTDVILDLYLDREPFAENAAKLWKAHEAGDLIVYVSAITPVNLFYVARKLKGADVAQKAVAVLLNSLPVCTVDLAVLQNGLAAGFKDFEDAVQHACAVAAGLDGIVTRNSSDYQRATLPVYTPSDYLRMFPVTS